MLSIPIYLAELQDGLASAIAGNVITYASEVRAVDRFDISEKALARLKTLSRERVQAGKFDFDLHYVDTILATTGWNKNDDVFDQVEMWTARHTPEHKPFNYEHDCSAIIGHIVSNWVMDDEGKAVDENSTTGNLPAKFHIVTGAVLYSVWDKPELQERMDVLLEEISKGEWACSMEAIFAGFSYALQAKDGTAKVIARNEETAFLTKHLRVYGGTGEYQGYKIGRLMRNITFSGKGLVRKPANPDSIILSDGVPFQAKSEILTNFSQLTAQQVYESASGVNKTESVKNMAIELELQKQIDLLKNENEKLKADLHDTNLKDFKSQCEKSLADKSKSDELLKSAEGALLATKAEIDALKKSEDAVKAKLVETEKSLAETSDELKTIYATQKSAERLAKVKSALKVADGDEESLKKATTFADSLSELSDEKFDSVLVGVNMMTAATEVKPVPKSTPAPLPPKSTPAPLPPKVKGAEIDDVGEAAADAAILTGVESSEAALSVQPADAGVSDVAKAIASYFGVKAEQE